jgi:hypothetical protein
VAELSRREDLLAPLLQAADWDVESRRDDAALVESAQELNHDLVGSVVIDQLELADVACFTR